MAGQTKTVSGNTTTYTITDVEGCSVALSYTNYFGGGKVINALTLNLNGQTGFHQDGQQMLTTLLQLLSTGLTP